MEPSNLKAGNGTTLTGRTARIAARVIQWTLALLALASGSLWAGWLLADAVEDADDGQ